MVFGYYITINLWLFLIIGLDKKRARAHKWRIKEKSLWAAALAGGALGGSLGMQAFHHKTKHMAFRVGFPLLMLLQLFLLGYAIVQFYK
ncbi:DUF1294 domain-containing protein [Halobacillus salinarum]|uniref:DUF1294 domain-containing protein n=2 Tax=Halobacillus salinarum TaxID=2932257 RepID=A0ABY4EPQ4_9BACI|nr:DUF1294 domain-containing protein [Halobacillus salinarum]